MNANILNQQLHTLYTDYLKHIYAQQWDDKVSAPLLMHVFDDYTRMPCKVLVVGKETHGWRKMNDRLTVSDLQDDYKNFDLGKKADYRDGKKLRYLRSPFWNFNRSLFYNLNNSYSDVSRKTSGFLWTNISKFDYNNGTPSEELQNKNESGFELLRKEISVIQPDVVLFTTGNRYDHRIEAALNIHVPQLSAELPLVRLNNINGLSAEYIFKTEHPRTLCQHSKYLGKRMYHQVIEKIASIVGG